MPTHASNQRAWEWQSFDSLILSSRRPQQLQQHSRRKSHQPGCSGCYKGGWGGGARHQRIIKSVDHIKNWQGPVGRPLLCLTEKFCNVTWDTDSTWKNGGKQFDPSVINNECGWSDWAKQVTLVHCGPPTNKKSSYERLILHDMVLELACSGLWDGTLVACVGISEKVCYGYTVLCIRYQNLFLYFFH